MFDLLGVRAHAESLGIDFDKLVGNNRGKKKPPSKKMKPVRVTCVCGNSFKVRVLPFKSYYCNKCLGRVDLPI